MPMQSSWLQNKSLTGFLCVIVVVQFLLLLKLGVNPMPESEGSVVQSTGGATWSGSNSFGKPKAPTSIPNATAAKLQAGADAARVQAELENAKAAISEIRNDAATHQYQLDTLRAQLAEEAEARSAGDADTKVDASKIEELQAELVEATWKTSVCEDTPLDVDSIQIHILSWKRPQSLYVLLGQLRAADYSGWGKDVPLYVHVDGGADPLVIQIAWSTKWQHGPLVTDIRDSNVGLREMWLSSMRDAAKAAGPNTLMIVLEDDMRISSIYFQWVLLMVKAYGRNRQCRHQSLMGFSLSPVRWMEMRKPFSRWRAKETFPTHARLNHAYLSTLPSSWGGSFWTDRWLEFDDFVSERLTPMYYNITAEADARTVKSFADLKLTPEALYIPDSRSNWWPASWKRFLVDFMYGCGLFMLYPNLQGENGLASTLSLQGKHTMHKDSKGEREDDELAADSRIVAPRKIDWQRKPQIAPLIKGDMQLIKNMRLPDITALQMTSLWMEPITIEDGVRTGAAFVRELIANEEFAEIGRAWCSSVRTRSPSGVANVMV